MNLIALSLSVVVWAKKEEMASMVATAATAATAGVTAEAIAVTVGTAAAAAAVASTRKRRETMDAMGVEMAVMGVTEAETDQAGPTEEVLLPAVGMAEEMVEATAEMAAVDLIMEETVEGMVATAGMAPTEATVITAAMAAMAEMVGTA